MSGASIDYLINFLNIFINDIYLSFILTSTIFTINNNKSIIHFFNLEERKIKIYFFIFLLMSIINVPNYLFYQKRMIILFRIDFLKLKLILFDILKTIIFIYLINKQIKIISKIIYIYSIYHLINNINCLKIKTIFLKIIKFIFFIILFFNIIIDNITFRKFKNNMFYWNIISKCIIENYNSFLIFLFWIILNISEENNPIFIRYINMNNNEQKCNSFKFNINNEITNENFHKIKKDINSSKYPIIIFNLILKKLIFLILTI